MGVGIDTVCCQRTKQQEVIFKAAQVFLMDLNYEVMEFLNWHFQSTTKRIMQTLRIYRGILSGPVTCKIPGNETSSLVDI